MRPRTFIHHDGALGDVLLSLPAFDAIRKHSGSVHLSAHSGAAGLLKESGYADSISPVDSALFLPLYSGGADKRAEEFLSAFDMAFVFTVKEDSAFVRNISAAIPDTRAVVTIPPEHERVHVSEFRLEQLAAFGFKPAAGFRTQPFLRVPSVPRARAKRFLSESGWRGSGMPLVAVHPGSGGRRKCWQTEKFLGLMERMKSEQDVFFIVLSGPAEDRLMREKINGFARSHKDIAHVSGEELAAVAALLSMCDLYIGNDSGVTHLAAAAGANVVAIFGHTDSLLWKPGGSRVKVVAPDTGCAPCDSRMQGGKKGNCSLECLSDISVDKVYASLPLPGA